MKAAIRLSVSAFAAAFAFALPANAQVTFAGSTLGCFYTGAVCTPGLGPTSVGPLTFLNSTFSVTSSAGFAAIGETPASPNFNNLGSFSLPANASGFTGSGNAFALNVMFTGPVGTIPPSSSYLATLVGSVSTTGGGLFIDFDNTAKLFTFAGGSFTLAVQDVSVTNAAGVNVVPVTGFINVTLTTVPEPGTYALMAIGLAGLFLATRRRRTMYARAGHSVRLRA